MKPINTNRYRTLKNKATNYRNLSVKYRMLMIRFIKCFTKTSEGFFLYEDKLPELQSIRNQGTELLKLKVNFNGNITQRR